MFQRANTPGHIKMKRKDDVWIATQATSSCFKWTRLHWSRCPRELQHLQSKIQFFVSIHYLPRLWGGSGSVAGKKHTLVHWIPGSPSWFGLYVRFRTSMRPLPEPV